MHSHAGAWERGKMVGFAAALPTLRSLPPTLALPRVTPLSQFQTPMEFLFQHNYHSAVELNRKFVM